MCVGFQRRVILSNAKDLYTSTLCLQILHFVQNDTHGRIGSNAKVRPCTLPQQDVASYPDKM